jgi:uncharacterized protein YggE
MDTMRTWLSRRGPAVLASLVLGGLLLGAVQASSGPVAAHDDRCTLSSNYTSLYLNGHGSVKLEPDTAAVTVGVDVIRPTLAAAQNVATEQATAIIDAVKAAGVAEEDIQTANFSVNIVYDYDKSPATVEGYQVSNQVNVTIRDLESVGAILDAVVAAGANNIYGITFYVDDPTAAASQARALAIQDARTKADEIAAAADLVVCRISSISESYSPVAPPVAFDTRAAAAEMSAAAPVPIQTGTSEVVVDVQVNFELK